MKRFALACVAGVLLSIGMVGCGDDSGAIPEGYSEDDIKEKADAAPKQAPMSGEASPTKSGG